MLTYLGRRARPPGSGHPLRQGPGVGDGRAVECVIRGSGIVTATGGRLSCLHVPSQACSPERNRSAPHEDFFRALKRQNRNPEAVAECYGRFLWDEKARSLIDEKVLSRSRFYVGLSTGNSSQDFERITKRAALISDTLLLSHDWTGEYHKLGCPFTDPVELGRRPQVRSWVVVCGR